MPYMLNPANYTQTMRPNLYNMAYRRIGAYKGMGRLHPSNYLEIGGRPNRIGATAGQYNTLSGQLSLLPPSLRGLGRFWRRGLGQYNFAQSTPTWSQFAAGTAGTYGASGLTVDQSTGGLIATSVTPNFSGSSGYTTDSSGALVATDFSSAAGAVGNPFSSYGSSASGGGGSAPTPTGISNQTLMLIAGGLLLAALMGGRR